MSEINYGDLNIKEMMLNYLRMSGRENMIEAVEKFCDDECGIVFNKHPATDEEKFSIIYDYASSPNPSSATSHLSGVAISEPTLSKEFPKSFKRISSVFGSKDNFIRGSQMLIRPENKKTDIYRQKKKEIVNKINNTENTTKIVTKISNSKNTDHLYDILAPNGKGKFQKFIGEDFIYVLLEDGTHNCYPIDLVKYNPAYIKANPLYNNIKKNYNDIALEHTKNILKSNKKNLCTIETNPNKQEKFSDEFLNFSEETNYLKEALKNDTMQEESFRKNYFIHLQTKKQISHTYQNDEYEKNMYVQNPTCNPIKKNIQVTTMNNVYKLQNIEPYKPVEEIIDENEICEVCC